MIKVARSFLHMLLFLCSAEARKVAVTIPVLRSSLVRLFFSFACFVRLLTVHGGSDAMSCEHSVSSIEDMSFLQNVGGRKYTIMV